MILGPPLDHLLDRRLMLQEIAAVDGVVEVQPLGVALLTRQVVDAVDSALGADAMRARTGVRLIRSTSTPSSASFMAAASPASPPPTIITRCLPFRDYLFQIDCVALAARGVAVHGSSRLGAGLLLLRGPAFLVLSFGLELLQDFFFAA